MKEGPEALVGGPPLSLSEGPAFSAFRLRPSGRDATSATSEDVLSPLTLAHWHRLTPICPVKAFLQQLSLLWCFLDGAAPVDKGGRERGGYEKEKRHGVLRGLAFWFYVGPLCFSHSAFAVYETSILIPSHVSPRAEVRCSS